MLNCFAVDSYSSDEIKNERPIIFKANDGQEVDAFEGHLMVTENRGSAKSRKIRINYVRFPATGKKTGAPIIYLAGGPGGSGIATAKWRRFPLFMALRAHSDVIALDQRGTGASEKAPVCKASATVSLVERVTQTQIVKHYQNALKECQTYWSEQKVDVLGYTTVQNAWDLNDLRQHLNVEKITLWGISYGSHLALAALSLFEPHIDKIIIASAEGLDQTVKLPINTYAYFSRVQDVINKHPELIASYTNISDRMQKIHQQLADKPIELTLKNEDGTTTPFLFQKHHMQLLASMMISDPGQYLAMLLSAYRDLSQKNYQSLIELLERGMFSDTNISLSIMSTAMDIASGVSSPRLAQIHAQAKTGLLGDLLNFPMPHLNKAIPELDLGDEFRTPKDSTVPTLLLTGTLDGRTYLEGQKQAVAHLSNVIQVNVVNGGHNLFVSSPDVLKTMLNFLNGREIKNRSIIVEPEFIDYLKQSL